MVGRRPGRSRHHENIGCDSVTLTQGYPGNLEASASVGLAEAFRGHSLMVRARTPAGRVALSET